MLTAEPRPADVYLPRALSPAWADDHEIAFLLDLRGAGTRALAGCEWVSMLGPLGRGFEPEPGSGDPGRWRYRRGGAAVASSPARAPIGP